MARPPEPELTPTEAEALQRALRALERELAQSLAGSREAAAPVDLDEPIGRVSRIDAIQQQKMVEASRDGMALRARQVRAALARVAEGTYGECVSCEENVGYRRLEARPEAPFCIACQSRSERGSR